MMLVARCKSKTSRVSCICDWLHDATGLGFERGQCWCEFVNSIKYTFAHIFSKVTFSVYELIKLMSFSTYMFF